MKTQNRTYWATRSITITIKVCLPSVRYCDCPLPSYSTFWEFALFSNSGSIAKSKKVTKILRNVRECARRDLYESGLYFGREALTVNDPPRRGLKDSQLYGYGLTFPPVRTPYSKNTSTNYTVMRTYSMLYCTNYAVMRTYSTLYCTNHTVMRTCVRKVH